MPQLFMARVAFDPAAASIVLDVELRGHFQITTRRMVLDTGATLITIPWEVAELLGYQPELSREKTTMITASGVESAPLITLKSVSVLGKRAGNVQALVHDLPQKSYVEGLLGLSFLRTFHLAIDFRKGWLELK